MKYDDAIAIVRDDAPAAPPAARREELRTAILAAAANVKSATPTSWRRAWIAGAGVAVVAAAAAIAFAMFRGGADDTHHRGKVIAQAGARFTTTAVPDEIVRFADGVIDVEVAPLHTGERFRVVVGDAEIEVRGTAFEVEAHADHLARVRVTHGRVEVRPTGGPVRVLGADDVWTPPAPPPLPPAHVAAALPVPVPAVTPVVSTTTASPHHNNIKPPPPDRITTGSTVPAAAVATGGGEYNEAWDAMRGEHFETAATAFARVVVLAPEGPFADDARFWSAVAHSRAKHPAIAIAAFRELVDDHPSSAHAAEANAMLGWLLLDAKAFPEARRRFVAAVTTTTSARIRASAQAGLDTLDQHDK